MTNSKLYNRKRPAHPDEKHKGKFKRFFKKLGRKRARRWLKKGLNRYV